MSELANPDGFKRVESSFDTSHGTRTGAAKCYISATGWTSTSTAATRMILPKATLANETFEQFTVAFDVNQDLRKIRVMVVDPGEKGATAARLSKDRRNVMFHLGGVFRDYPDLAVTYDRECPLRREPDGHLVIALAAAVAKKQDPVDEQTRLNRKRKNKPEPGNPSPSGDQKPQ